MKSIFMLEKKCASDAISRSKSIEPSVLTKHILVDSDFGSTLNNFPPDCATDYISTALDACLQLFDSFDKDSTILTDNEYTNLRGRFSSLLHSYHTFTKKADSAMKVDTSSGDCHWLSLRQPSPFVNLFNGSQSNVAISAAAASVSNAASNTATVTPAPPTIAAQPQTTVTTTTANNSFIIGSNAQLTVTQQTSAVASNARIPRLKITMATENIDKALTDEIETRFILSERQYFIIEDMTSDTHLTFIVRCVKKMRVKTTMICILAVAIKKVKQNAGANAAAVDTWGVKVATLEKLKKAMFPQMNGRVQFTDTGRSDDSWVGIVKKHAGADGNYSWNFANTYLFKFFSVISEIKYEKAIKRAANLKL